MSLVTVAVARNTRNVAWINMNGETMTEPIEHKHVKTRDPRWKHDIYTCVCGFESESTSEFNMHIGNNEALNAPIPIE